MKLTKEDFEMNRRSLLTTLTSFPLTARTVFAAVAGMEVGAAPAQIAGSDQGRYQLTLDRVLHGIGSAYTWTCPHF
jgi:hypothetical protein